MDILCWSHVNLCNFAGFSPSSTQWPDGVRKLAGSVLHQPERRVCAQRAWADDGGSLVGAFSKCPVCLPLKVSGRSEASAGNLQEVLPVLLQTRVRQAPEASQQQHFDQLTLISLPEKQISDADMCNVVLSYPSFHLLTVQRHQD